MKWLVVFLFTSIALGAPSLEVFWTDNSDNENAFLVERKVGTGRFVLLDAVNRNVTKYVDKGVKYNVLYTYRIRARREERFSPYSNEAKATVSEDGEDKINAPTGLGIRIIK